MINNTDDNLFRDKLYKRFSKETIEELEYLRLNGRNSRSHIWKKYILEFISKFKTNDFTFEDILKYLKREYGKTYEDLSSEQFEGRVKSTLNQLTKDGSFRKSRDFNYELEKHGLHDIKLEKYKDSWNFKLTTLNQHKEKQELLQRLKK